ncbi:MAG: hypothetical protein AB1467_05030 [Candidatus Diapherotrites archaeon]
METLKVQLDRKKAELFRMNAMKTYGYSKGAISRALNDAIDKWLERLQFKGTKKRKYKVDELVGLIKDIKMDSVEAQHEALKILLKSGRNVHN